MKILDLDTFNPKFRFNRLWQSFIFRKIEELDFLFEFCIVKESMLRSIDKSIVDVLVYDAL